MTNVSAKRLDGNLRAKLVSAIDKSKDQNYDKFRDKIKNNKVIEGLFYADSVSINVTKKADIDFSADADIAKLKGVSVTPKANSDGTYSYVFKGTNKSPFAAQLIDGKSL